MARVTGSHLIGKALKLESVTNIFTIAGDHILPVLDVISDMDFRFVDTRHEQAAVHMAGRLGPDYRADRRLHVHYPRLRQRHSRP